MSLKGDYAIGLSTFRYLDRCLNHRPVAQKADIPTIAGELHESDNEAAKLSQNLRLQFRRQVLACCGGPQAVFGGLKGNDCIRNCLEWCIRELRSFNPDSLPRALTAALSQLGNRESAEILILYCLLYMRCIPTVEDETYEAYFRWAHPVELNIGISGAELLKIIVYLVMTLGKVSIRRTPFLPISQMINASDLIHRALRAADSLWELSDEELADKLVTTFIDGTHTTHLEEGIRIIGWGGADEVFRFFVETCLHVILPSFAMSKATKDSSLRQAPGPPPKRSGSSYNPTLAPSLQSSEWSSFRRLAVQANDRGNRSNYTVSSRLSWSRRASWMSLFGAKPLSIDELSQTMSTMDIAQAVIQEGTDEDESRV